MKKNFETLLKELGAQEKLAPEKRVRMRALLQEYARLQPRREAIAPQRSSFFGSFLQRTMARPALAFAVLVLIVFTTTSSLAYAAEGTLPGDPLYPFKVDVSEPLRTAFTFTPEAQVAWQIALATRRADEAAALASRGTLSTTTENLLATRFTQHVQVAREFFVQHPKDAQHSTSEDTIATTRLSAYESVFTHMRADHTGSNAAAFQAALSTGIASLVSTETNSATSTESHTKATDEQSVVSITAVLQLRQNVGRALLMTNENLTASGPLLTASSSAAAKAQLSEATALANQGETLFAAGNRNAATTAFLQSLRLATRLEVLIHAAAYLKVNALEDTSDTTTDASSTLPIPPPVRDTHIPPTTGTSETSQQATEPAPSAAPILHGNTTSGGTPSIDASGGASTKKSTTTPSEHTEHPTPPSSPADGSGSTAPTQTFPSLPFSL